jgi:hypothetical protein
VEQEWEQIKLAMTEAANEVIQMLSKKREMNCGMKITI